MVLVGGVGKGEGRGDAWEDELCLGRGDGCGKRADGAGRWIVYGARR